MKRRILIDTLGKGAAAAFLARNDFWRIAPAAQRWTRTATDWLRSTKCENSSRQSAVSRPGPRRRSSGRPWPAY